MRCPRSSHMPDLVQMSKWLSAECVYLISMLWGCDSLSLFVRNKKLWYFRTAHFCENENREWYVCCGKKRCPNTMFADQVIVFSEGGVYQFMVAEHLRFSVNIYLLRWASSACFRWWAMAVWEAWLVMGHHATPHSLATHKLVSFVFANISQTHNLHGPQLGAVGSLCCDPRSSVLLSIGDCEIYFGIVVWPYVMVPAIPILHSLLKFENLTLTQF